MHLKAAVLGNKNEEEISLKEEKMSAWRAFSVTSSGPERVNLMGPTIRF